MNRGTTTAARNEAPVRHTPRSADTDVGLMVRVKNDEPGAFAEVVARYWGQLFGRFFRQLGDRQEAEDLTQEVFLRLYRSRYRYQPRARLTTWLFHIAQNVARNALRTRRRRPFVSLGRLAGRDQNCRPGDRYRGVRQETPPCGPAEKAELARVVRAAVTRLAARQRRAVELHQLQDWTYEEVAAEMAMSLQAAKGLLYRARNQLRTCLGPYAEV